MKIQNHKIKKNTKPSKLRILTPSEMKIIFYYNYSIMNENNILFNQYDFENLHIFFDTFDKQTDYDERSDIWSIGVIFLELLTRTTPIFRPDKKVKTRWESHLMSIFKILGKPDKETIMSFASKERCKDILKFKYFPKVELKDLYPNVDKLAIDLLEKLLCIEPKKRISILQAKKHKYFDIIKDLFSLILNFDFFMKQETIQIQCIHF